MIPPCPPNLGPAPEGGRWPKPSPAPPRAFRPARSADLARQALGSLRERLGTAPLYDRRATGALDVERWVPRAVEVDLEKIDLGTNTLSLGPGRKTPTSKLRLA